MEGERELDFPRELELRMMKILSEDIDLRLKDLTVLVALQETELSVLWFTIIALSTYIIIKEHNGR